MLLLLASAAVVLVGLPSEVSLLEALLWVLPPPLLPLPDPLLRLLPLLLLQQRLLVV